MGAGIETLQLRRGWERLPGAAVPGAIWRFGRRKPLGAFGGLVIVLLVLMAVFAGPIARRDPTSIPVADVAEERLQKPGPDHLMGTDDKGRDIFARVVYGSRVSLEVGIIAVTIAVTLGTVLGLMSGFFGGSFDTLLQRLVDAQMSFPGLVLGLVLVGLLGQKLHYVFIAVGIVALPTYIRLVRGSVLSVKQNLYVEAAKVLGAGDGRIMFRHVLPNVMAPIIVVATAGLGGAILVEASLSFLGFGPPPPAPSWGRMLSGESRIFMLSGAWWMAVFPGVAITLAVLAFNLLGDALRDVLDPRLRGA